MGAICPPDFRECSCVRQCSDKQRNAPLSPRYNLALKIAVGRVQKQAARMPIPVTVTVATKTITAESFGADAAQAKEWMSSGSFQSVQVTHDAGELLPKEKKELAAFCLFARHPGFEEVVVRLTGTKPEGVLKLLILSSAKNEDPPDLILAMGHKDLAIEVTDFPPDQEAMQKAMGEHHGAAPLPLFHESGCSPDFIKQFIAKGVSHTEPHAGELPTEIVALYDYARVTIKDKDDRGRSELLLLHGPMAFSYPEADVIAYVTANAVFKSLKGVVFVLQNEIRVFWTNLA